MQYAVRNDGTRRYRAIRAYSIFCCIYLLFQRQLAIAVVKATLRSLSCKDPLRRPPSF